MSLGKLAFLMLAPTIIDLSPESRLLLGTIPKKISPDFESLWNQKPSRFDTIKVFGREVQSPRWVAVYMKAYKYSGVMHESTPLPTELEPLLVWANENFADPVDARFNQALVNFYGDGNHYMGRHSDDEKEIIPKSAIFSASFGQERIFRIRERKSKKIVQDIVMKDGTYLVMCGNMQKEFSHEVPKVGGIKGKSMGRRINVTFRMFL
jgi:alkylated DNA repair dioxygenase AlkB